MLVGCITCDDFLAPFLIFSGNNEWGGDRILSYKKGSRNDLPSSKPISSLLRVALFSFSSSTDPRAGDGRRALYLSYMVRPR